MGLHEALADGKPEPACDALRAVVAGGVPAKEQRQPLGCEALPLVDDRDGDMRALAQGLDADG